MAYIDRFLELLATNGGSALLLVGDDVARMELGGTPRAITNKPFSAAQLLSLLREIAPMDAVRDLDGGAGATFRYASPSGDFRAHAVRDGEKLRVEVTPVGTALTSPLAEAAVAPPATGTNGQSDALVARADGTNGHGNGNGHTSHAPVGDSAARAEMERLLRLLSDRGASDLHLRVGEPPVLRVHGDIIRLDEERPVGNDALEAMITSIMPQRNLDEYRELNDTDFAHEIAGLARFRCNAMRELRGAGAVFRVVSSKMVTADELGLSAEVQRLCHLSKGLVLVTGPTGSGKSTTLCALIDLINRTRSDHVITIEDPIEFVHANKKCIITQRQVGSHTSSFRHALRAALREDPDIILVGELRDLETMSIAIETAETGHLVFGTLHTSTAPSTIDRVIDQFPTDRQEQVRVMLSESLKGVVSQTLCKRASGGRVAAREILLTTPAVSNLIREGKTYQIPSIIQTSKRLGMVTLNDALLDLVDTRIVEPKEAYMKAIDKQALITAFKTRGHDTSLIDPAEAGPTAKPEPAGGKSGLRPAGAR
ncbi:MAG: type IV pilus twitching motility protein PilT [Gemmatimonadaceae bacterium]